MAAQKKGEITVRDLDATRKRFAFINVWRGILDTPIYRMPLAVADTSTVPRDDHFIYHLCFPGAAWTLSPVLLGLLYANLRQTSRRHALAI